MLAVQIGAFRDHHHVENGAHNGHVSRQILEFDVQVLRLWLDVLCDQRVVLRGQQEAEAEQD